MEGFHICCGDTALRTAKMWENSAEERPDPGKTGTRTLCSMYKYVSDGDHSMMSSTLG